MRDALRGIVIGLVLLAIGGALAARYGVASVDVPRCSGTAAWLVSRVAGLTAFVAVSLDVILGLLVSTRTLSRLFAKGAAVELHRWLSPVALALVLGHGVLLLADGYIRFDVLAVLVPFASPYRPVAVAVGVVAAYLALVVHVSFALRKRIGVKMWRRLHALSFAVLIGAAAHGLLAGSDRGSVWLVYAVPLAITLALVLSRLERSR
jgi:predicted ferric reductase